MLNLVPTTFRPPRLAKGHPDARDHRTSISEAEALAKGIEEKAKEFVEKGAEVYQEV